MKFKSVFYSKIRYTIRKNINIINFELINNYTGIVYREFYFLKYHLFNINIYKIDGNNFDEIFKKINEKYKFYLNKN